CEIVLTEDGDRADLLADFELIALAREVALDHLVGQIRQGRRGVYATAREVDRVVVDVSGKDAHGVARQLVAERLGDEHGQRVRLFARRTARAPDAQLAIPLSGVRNQTRNDV